MAEPTVSRPENRFYVYIIYRPDYTPCYVGKGYGKRWNKHNQTGSHNLHLKRITLNAGGHLPKIKVCENLTDAQALACEVALIKSIGREDHGGPLVNKTDGGEGVSGLKRSAESIEKNRQRQLGFRHSEETKRKLSIIFSAPRGPMSETGRRNISKAQKGIKKGPVSAETRAKHSARQKGIPKGPMSPESLAKMRATRLAQRSAPGWKPKKWLRDINGLVYMAEERRNESDIEGHGRPLHPAMANTVRGTKWWRTPEGKLYRSVECRSEEDRSGKK